MNRITKAAFLALLALPAVAFADIKLGYVDLQRALKEVGEGQAAKSALEKEASKRKSEFDAEQNKLRDDKTILDKQGPMMSEETRNQKFTELQKRLFELTQKAEKLQAEMAQMEQRELKKIFEKMDPIIADIAQREGLTMVFEKTDSGLVYAPPSLDLTNELVRTYNTKYKVGAPVKKEGAPKDVAKEAPKDAPKP
jgi:outer membrane protein